MPTSRILEICHHSTLVATRALRHRHRAAQNRIRQHRLRRSAGAARRTPRPAWSHFTKNSSSTTSIPRVSPTPRPPLSRPLGQGHSRKRTSPSTRDVQYDRTANIWIGPTNIYFGTTSEPSHNVARHWHVERDLTDYSSIFTIAQAGTVDLGNLVNQTYTGILHGSANPLLSAGRRAKPRPVPPIKSSLSPEAPPAAPSPSTPRTDLLEQTVTLPTNITSLYFDVFAQSQSNDEFWYTCVPNDVAGELESCPRHCLPRVRSHHRRHARRSRARLPLDLYRRYRPLSLASHPRSSNHELPALPRQPDALRRHAQ